MSLKGQEKLRPLATASVKKRGLGALGTPSRPRSKGDMGEQRPLLSVKKPGLGVLGALCRSRSEETWESGDHFCLSRMENGL